MAAEQPEKPIPRRRLVRTGTPAREVSPEPARRVEQAIAAIWQLYQAGTETLAVYPGEAPMFWIDEEARRRGMHPETLRRARVFAHPEKGYTPDELEELFMEMRKHGTAIGQVHVIRLLAVHNRHQRRMLQRAMLEHRWTRQDLDRQLRLLRGDPVPRTRPVGRPTTVSLLDVLAAVEQFISGTSRSAQLLEWLTSDPASDFLSPATTRYLRSAREPLQETSRLMESELKRLVGNLRDVSAQEAESTPTRKADRSLPAGVSERVEPSASQRNEAPPPVAGTNRPPRHSPPLPGGPEAGPPGGPAAADAHFHCPVFDTPRLRVAGHRGGTPETA